MKKTNKNTSMGMAMGMCFGVAMGTSIGTVFDNISMGSSMGLIIGMLIGLVIGAMKDEKVNKQLKEKGYTILAIEQNETDEVYIITIVNSANEESLIYVPKGQMEAEDFQIGDVVYLDDDGMIEPSKLEAITCDSVRHTYMKLGEKAGNAFSDGNQLK